MRTDSSSERDHDMAECNTTTKQLRVHIHMKIYRRHGGERRDYPVLDTALT